MAGNAENESGETEEQIVAGTGWCSPSEEQFPDISVRRGGISFTDPYGHLTREQLIERWQNAERRVNKRDAKIRRLKETRRRLRFIIERAY